MKLEFLNYLEFGICFLEFKNYMEGISPIKWFIIIFVGLWVVWYFTGGPQRYESQGGLYIKQPESPFDTKWDVYTNTTKSLTFFTQGNSNDSTSVQDTLEKAQELAGSSVYKDKIVLKNGNARSTNPNEEYLVLETSGKNTNRIDITGWYLKSAVTGNTLQIKKASGLPITSNVNNENDIFVGPSEKIYITTGRSPIGVSFKTNICTGYLEQFQDFTPTLSRQCPKPEFNSLNDDCLDFIESIPRCEMNTKEIPLGIPYECSQFITSKINYQSCVDGYKNTSDFYGKEWRIFAGRDIEYWKDKRETIILYDSNGKLVDSITY